MSKAEQQATGLMAKLQREQCYLIMMRPAEDPKVAPIPKAEMRLEHHDYLVDMERRGILFAAGPLRDDEGWERGHGCAECVWRHADGLDGEPERWLCGAGRLVYAGELTSEHRCWHAVGARPRHERDSRH